MLTTFPNTILLSVARLEFQPDSRAGQIGPELAAGWRKRSVEQQVFDTRVIVKIFDVPERDGRTARMHMEGRTAMSREFDGLRLAQGSHLQESGDASTPCGVRLEDVHCL